MLRVQDNHDGEQGSRETDIALECPSTRVAETLNPDPQTQG